MFISKIALSRRAVLRGMGAALALPILDAMVPALSPVARAVTAPPSRFGVIFAPLGARPGYWTPNSTGSNFEMSPILKPLTPHQDVLTVVSSLDNPAAGHAPTDSGWLSGSRIKQTAAEDVYAGKTIDQVIAERVGKSTALSSIELATADWSGYLGNCDGQYACVYASSISWKTPTTPLPTETNPRLVFERLFGAAGTPAQRLERLQRRKSVIDAVKGDLSSLESGLGPKDRNRLADYLENIRAVEESIEKSEKQSSVDVRVPDAPVGIPEDYETHVALQFELLALAYQADITRVFTFMLDRDLTQRVYPNLGVTEPHHATSHHGGDVEKIANLVKINTYHASLFSKFLDRLKATPDGDGTLLDHSLILYGSGMSESNVHSNIDIPTLLAGGGMGMKGNRHVKAAAGTPLSNLFVDLAQRYDIDIDKFGLSTGRLQL